MTRTRKIRRFVAGMLLLAAACYVFMEYCYADGFMGTAATSRAEYPDRDQAGWEKVIL